MNAPIDTLAFAKSFEEAGFGQEQARVLATAFGRSHDDAREGLLTKTELDLRLSEFEARLNKQLGDMEARMNKQLGDMEVRLTRQIGENGKDVSGRLWSAITIVAGVATTISAVVAAATALLLKYGGL